MATEDMIVAAACLYQRGYSAKTLVRIYWPWTIGRRSTAVCGWCSPVAAVWWDAPRGTDAGSPDWWSCSVTHTQQTVRWPLRHRAYVCAWVSVCTRTCSYVDVLRHIDERRCATVVYQQQSLHKSKLNTQRWVNSVVCSNTHKKRNQQSRTRQRT